MRLDFTLTNNLEILHSVKNVTLDDLYRVYFISRTISQTH